MSLADDDTKIAMSVAKQIAEKCSELLVTVVDRGHRVILKDNCQLSATIAHQRRRWRAPGQAETDIALPGATDEQTDLARLQMAERFGQPYKCRQGQFRHADIQESNWREHSALSLWWCFARGTSRLPKGFRDCGLR
jgi:hypothetical protein